MEDMEDDDVMEQAKKGRGGDTVMAHLTLGEMVLPAPMVADPEVQQVLGALFQAYGANPNEFTVGDPANKINPETGEMEFGWLSKIFKKIAPIALPILGTLMAPGIGTSLGLGATGGLLSSTGLGLSNAAITGLGGALGGAAGGLAGGGGLKGALTGAALGGSGGYITGAGGLAGAAEGLGMGTVGLPASGSTISSLAAGQGLGSAASGALGGLGNAGGTGLAGALSGLSSGAGGLLSTPNIARIGGSLYGAAQEDEAAKKAREAMLAQTNPYNEMGLKAQTQLSNNLSEGFNPGDLTSDPGYQFRLKQGQDALNASLAAQGLSESGPALKAAQEYGQNFAANEYSNAYDRWLQQNSQLSGVGSQGLQTAAATGNTMGNYYQQEAERKNKRISEILAGLGYGA